MVNLSLNELKLIAKNRGIKDQKSKSRDELTKIISKPESKIDSLELRIKEIREEFNELEDRFSKPKMKEIRRNLYENEKNLFTPKIKEIEKNLELEKNLSNLKKYYDYIVGPLLPPPLLFSKN